MYTRSWNDLVEIEDIYEQRYIVACDDPEGFIRAVADMKAAWEMELLTLSGRLVETQKL
jgi:hypothetical protein